MPKNVKYKNDKEKTITSDMELFDISYYKSKLYLSNMDNFVDYVKGCVKLVRKHPDYDNFVETIRAEHMDHCQVLGNIDRFSATLEMHHGPMLTLFDYCAIMVQHFLVNDIPINTFQVAKAVLEEHYNENVQVVMMCKTVHQLVDSGELFINLNQGIGNVEAFLDKYADGVTDVMVDKINEYIDMSKRFHSHDSHILDLEKNMVNWSYDKQPRRI